MSTALPILASAGAELARSTRRSHRVTPKMRETLQRAHTQGVLLAPHTLLCTLAMDRTVGCTADLVSGREVGPNRAGEVAGWLAEREASGNLSWVRTRIGSLAWYLPELDRYVAGFRDIEIPKQI